MDNKTLRIIRAVSDVVMTLCTVIATVVMVYAMAYLITDGGINETLRIINTK